MPIYEYRCQECSYQFELIRSANQADQPAPCPQCNSIQTKRLMSLINAFVGNGAERRSISSGCGSCSPTSSCSCSSCRV